MVHLGQAIGPVAVACSARELRIRQGRHVNQREWNVGIEPLAGAGLTLDKFHRPVRDLCFHGSTAIHVEYRDMPGFWPLRAS